jgi:hypothetical protein
MDDKDFVDFVATADMTQDAVKQTLLDYFKEFHNLEYDPERVVFWCAHSNATYDVNDLTRLLQENLRKSAARVIA